MQLVFIEGVSGVGKTTLALKLHEKLNDMGCKTESYLEGNFMNPIDFYCTAYLKQNEYAALIRDYSEFSHDIKDNTINAGDIRLIRYYNGETPLFTEPLLGVLRKYEFCYKPINLVPFPEYTRVYKSVWEQFAKRSSVQYDYMIFDGSLFHHPINDMMRNYEASCNQITCHINTLAEAVNPLRSRVIYLSSNDVAERLKKAHISRKQTAPSTEQVQFWQKRKQMDMIVIQHLSIPYNIYDISQENWNEQIGTILNGLTL